MAVCNRTNRLRSMVLWVPLTVAVVASSRSMVRWVLPMAAAVASSRNMVRWVLLTVAAEVWQPFSSHFSSFRPRLTFREGGVF